MELFGNGGCCDRQLFKHIHLLCTSVYMRSMTLPVPCCCNSVRAKKASFFFVVSIRWVYLCI